jgi:hypothetical protein
MKKSHILAKRNLRRLIKGEMATLEINGHLVGTWDFSVEQMQAPMSSLERRPLWDWFRVTNKKRDKLYYIDFSMPFREEEFNGEWIANGWAIADFIGKYPIEFNPVGDGKLVQRTESEESEIAHAERKKFYLDNNDWAKTQQAFDEVMTFRNALDVLLVSRNDDNDGWSIVVPARWGERDSIESIFSEYALPIMFGEIRGMVSTKLYSDEIKYERFV